MRTIRPAPNSRWTSATWNTGPPVRSQMARPVARAVRGTSGIVTTLPPLRVMVAEQASLRSSSRAIGEFAGGWHPLRETGWHPWRRSAPCLRLRSMAVRLSRDPISIRWFRNAAAVDKPDRGTGRSDEVKGKVIGVVATYLSGTASVSRIVRAASAHPADRPEGPASAALHLLSGSCADSMVRRCVSGCRADRSAQGEPVMLVRREWPDLEHARRCAVRRAAGPMAPSFSAALPGKWVVPRDWNG